MILMVVEPIILRGFHLDNLKHGSNFFFYEMRKFMTPLVEILLLNKFFYGAKVLILTWSS